MSEQLYTSSRLKVLRECLRKHFYKYVLNIRTPSSLAMEFGTVCHAALEAYLNAWKAGQLATRLHNAMQAIDASSLPPVEQMKLRVLMVAYDLRWGNEPWDVLAVEVEFRYQLGDYLVGGKIDAIIRDRRDGRVYVLEHKTTRQDASPGSVYWERLSIDAQVSIYVDGATMLGHEISGCIYDVLQRPGHEPKLATPTSKRKFTAGSGCPKCGGSGKAGAVVQGRGFYLVKFPGEPDKQIDCESCAATGWKLDKEGVPNAPRLHSNQRDVDETIEEFTDRLTEEVAGDLDAFLVRGVVVRLDDDLPKMRIDLLDTIKLERLTTVVFGDAQPRNPDACAAFGSLCPFFGPCSGRDSIDDQQRFPRGDVAHPELAAAA